MNTILHLTGSVIHTSNSGYFAMKHLLLVVVATVCFCTGQKPCGNAGCEQSTSATGLLQQKIVELSDFKVDDDSDALDFNDATGSRRRDDRRRRSRRRRRTRRRRSRRRDERRRRSDPRRRRNPSPAPAPVPPPVPSPEPAAPSPSSVPPAAPSTSPSPVVQKQGASTSFVCPSSVSIPSPPPFPRRRRGAAPMRNANNAPRRRASCNQFPERKGANLYFEDGTIESGLDCPLEESFSINEKSPVVAGQGRPYEANDIHNLQVVQVDWAREGSHILKVFANGENRGAWRSELGAVYNCYTFEVGDTFYYTASFWPDESWCQKSKYASVITQFKMSPGHPHAILKLSNLGDFKLTMKGGSKGELWDEWDGKNGQGEGRFIGYATPRAWNDVKIHAKWSLQNDGFVKVWLNGTQVFEHFGRTLLDKTDRGYVKFGMYTEIYDKRTLYFDAVRFSDHLDIPFDQWLNDQVNLPTVSLTSPSNGTRVASGRALSLSANAYDPSGNKYLSPGNVVQVEFFAGKCSIGVAPHSPYSIAPLLPDGSHVLSAVVTDGDGNTQQSDSVVVHVGNQAPQVEFSMPKMEDNIPAGQAVVLQAKATDEDGIVSQIAFYARSALGGPDTLVGTSTNNAGGVFEVSWQPAKGAYSLRAVASDEHGLSKSSSTVHVTVGADIQTQDLLATDDATLMEDKPTTKGNWYSSVEIYGNPDGKRKAAIFKFDISSVHGRAQTRKASLRLYAVFIKDDVPTGISVFKATSSAWREGDVTWSSKPGKGDRVAVLRVDAVKRYYDFDVTEYVSEALKAGSPYITFLLEEESLNYRRVDFGTIKTSFKPQLQVTTSSMSLPLHEVGPGTGPGTREDCSAFAGGVGPPSAASTLTTTLTSSAGAGSVSPTATTTETTASSAVVTTEAANPRSPLRPYVSSSSPRMTSVTLNWETGTVDSGLADPLKPSFSENKDGWTPPKNPLGQDCQTGKVSARDCWPNSVLQQHVGTSLHSVSVEKVGWAKDGEHVLKVFGNGWDLGAKGAFRSELSAVQDKYLFYEGDYQYFSMSFWLDSSWDQISKWSTLIAQWKMSPGHPHAAVRLSNEGDYKLYFKGGSNSELWQPTGPLDTKHGGRFLGTATPQAWNDLKILFKKSQSRDGFAKVWLNGQLVFEHNGKTLLKSGRGYTKFGMYTNIMGKRTIYFDAVSFCHSPSREECLDGKSLEQWVGNAGGNAVTTTTAAAGTTEAASPETTGSTNLRGECDWEVHPRTYSGGYAGGVSTLYPDIESAKAQCQVWSSDVCKAVTCRTSGECTVRRSASLAFSPSGETTYLRPADCIETTTAVTTTTTVTTAAATTATAAQTTASTAGGGTSVSTTPCPEIARLKQEVKEIAERLDEIAS
eukprot:TRINITY_DN28632_c0_g2_i1.p1 TRINITY_DN28632_c0_g2~~TRINITY_DN28632_c0_g2_i1.p1  ORF type:complete len:1374 (+),score=206.60 TRINITY_DN28632_c0_g2_i1:2-4123(+)